MSTVVTKNVQVGSSVTATNNFTIYQPASPDGTVRIANGNSGSTTDLVTVNSAGNVGVGTSSPAAKLDVNGPIRLPDGNEIGFGSANTTFWIGDSTNSWHRFFTSGSERARIDSSGNLLVGTTTGSQRLNVSGSSASGFVVKFTDSRTDGSSGAGMVEFFRTSGVVGTITTTTTTTSYNTSSDYRLKENVVPMTGALATVAQLKPCTYTWKADGSAGQGFIAHELQAVVPDAVTGEKDAVDKDGKPQYQGVDTSFLVATVVAALQELKAEFDAYKLTHP
jgi:hypothetical protein